MYNPFSNLENYYETITQLNWLFSAGNGIDVADKTVIDSDTLFKWYSEDFLKIVGNNFDSETVELKDGIKIYKALFDDIDTEIKDYHIKADDKHSIVSQKWSQSWWEKYVSGGHHKDGDITFTDDIEAIHEVKDSDFLADEELTCNSLYVSLLDYSEFKSFYDENKADKDIDFGDYRTYHSFNTCTAYHYTRYRLGHCASI